VALTAHFDMFWETNLWYANIGFVVYARKEISVNFFMNTT